MSGYSRAREGEFNLQGEALCEEGSGLPHLSDGTPAKPPWHVPELRHHPAASQSQHWWPGPPAGRVHTASCPPADCAPFTRRGTAQAGHRRAPTVSPCHVGQQLGPWDHQGPSGVRALQSPGPQGCERLLDFSGGTGSWRPSQVSPGGTASPQRVVPCFSVRAAPPRARTLCEGRSPPCTRGAPRASLESES